MAKVFPTERERTKGQMNLTLSNCKMMQVHLDTGRGGSHARLGMSCSLTPELAKAIGAEYVYNTGNGPRGNYNKLVLRANLGNGTASFQPGLGAAISFQVTELSGFSVVSRGGADKQAAPHLVLVFVASLATSAALPVAAYYLSNGQAEGTLNVEAEHQPGLFDGEETDGAEIQRTIEELIVPGDLEGVPEDQPSPAGDSGGKRGRKKAEKPAEKPAEEPKRGRGRHAVAALSPAEGEKPGKGKKKKGQNAHLFVSKAAAEELEPINPGGGEGSDLELIPIEDEPAE